MSRGYIGQARSGNVPFSQQMASAVGDIASAKAKYEAEMCEAEGGYIHRPHVEQVKPPVYRNVITGKTCTYQEQFTDPNPLVIKRTEPTPPMPTFTAPSVTLSAPPASITSFSSGGSWSAFPPTNTPSYAFQSAGTWTPGSSNNRC
jgi:hypothetical protein